MTTVFDISLRVLRRVTDVLEGTATDGGAAYLTDVERLTQPNEYYDRGTLFIKSGTHAGKLLRINGHLSNRLTFAPLGSVLCVQQVETVTALGTVTGDGNAAVVVTASGMGNSPKTIAVAVLNGDTASVAAGKIRTALAADADVKAFFTVSGSGADVILTTKTARANDTTLSVTVDNGTCTGLTLATSVNTTAGVAGPRYSVARGLFPLEQVYAAIQTALEETHVVDEDTSLTGDGTTLTFTLPAGVKDIEKVIFERPGVPGYTTPSTHWHEVNDELVFDYGLPPVNADILHLFYRREHDEITGYEVEIDRQIHEDWLVLAATRELLFWGAGMYGSKNHMIEDRLNKVLAELKGKPARRGMPTLIMKSAGGGRDHTRIT